MNIRSINEETIATSSQVMPPVIFQDKYRSFLNMSTYPAGQILTGAIYDRRGNDGIDSQ
jgi:hypothetical protein